jgi:phospholipid/cholesterol/gamma-HCH transport system permease protein
MGSGTLLRSALGRTGRSARGAVHGAARVSVLLVDTLGGIVRAPFRGERIRLRSAVEQFVEFGTRSLPIVCLICFLIGAIMAMQASYQLSRLGASRYIADLVGVAAMRELAPLMTAILLAGRCGSAIAAEIGTMKVSEEIDAFVVAGIDPVKHLVAPRFLGMLAAGPCVTVLAMLVMMAGGFALSTAVLGVDARSYLEETARALAGKDLVTGLVKSVFFSMVVCWVGVYRGFQVEGGAEGVGRKTTSSVVTSIVYIIVVDLVFTAIFYFL